VYYVPNFCYQVEFLSYINMEKVVKTRGGIYVHQTTYGNICYLEKLLYR
jgi:hypothetical protein